VGVVVKAVIETDERDETVPLNTADTETLVTTILSGLKEGRMASAWRREYGFGDNQGIRDLIDAIKEMHRDLPNIMTTTVDSKIIIVGDIHGKHPVVNGSNRKDA
jgi:hypothetical protein